MTDQQRDTDEMGPEGAARAKGFTEPADDDTEGHRRSNAALPGEQIPGEGDSDDDTEGHRAVR